MSKKILITGASGFVGYHLVEGALNRGYEVTAAVRRSSDISNLKAMGISILYFNLLDKSSLKEELEKGRFDYIIHNAGATRADSDDSFLNANAVSTKNLAEAAMECLVPVKKFVFISSMAAYGPKDSVKAGLARESDLPRPVTGYGRSKLQAERYLAEIAGLPYLIFRPTAIYGPREKDLLVVFQNVNKGLETYMGSAPQLQSFVFVKDLVDLVLSSLEKEITRKGYLVSDGHSYDQYQLALTAKRVLNKKTIKLHVPIPAVRFIASAMETTSKLLGKGTPILNKDRVKELTGSNYTCDIQAARQDLGFEPKYNLEQGLIETINWYKQNKWIN
jgi:nucleoside-diphosphate-sugar epimerase